MPDTLISHTNSAAALNGAAHWQAEQLFVDGENYFNDLLCHITRARHSILLETYIFELDTVGEPLLKALSQAASRGINVQLLLDGIGSYSSAGNICRQLISAGGQARIFHPLPWQWHLFQLALGQHNWLFGSFYYSWLINRRDHRKLAIIDQAYLYTGSINISASHLSHALGGDDWIDYAVRVEGENISDLADNFHRHWRQQHINNHQGLFRNYLSNLNPANRRRTNRHIVKAIDNAQQRIWLCNAYFSPSKRLLRALRRAVKRGLDVRIMVAGLSDIRFFPYLSSHYYQGLLQLGIRLFETPKRVLHAKAALIDNTVIIGSSNLNNRSRQHDLELDLLLRNSETVVQLKNSMERLQSEADELSQYSQPKRSPLLCSLVRSLRYWM